MFKRPLWKWIGGIIPIRCRHRKHFVPSLSYLFSSPREFREMGTGGAHLPVGSARYE